LTWDGQDLGVRRFDGVGRGLPLLFLDQPPQPKVEGVLEEEELGVLFFRQQLAEFLPEAVLRAAGLGVHGVDVVEDFGERPGVRRLGQRRAEFFQQEVAPFAVGPPDLLPPVVNAQECLFVAVFQRQEVDDLPR